ncbi:MAG: mechanosensitive ion channel family protein [Bacteroidetes bacterium]|nr:mechanosensitive ion channel family protein [Bacteroidota bacterium]
MEDYYIKIFETAIVFAIYFIARFSFKKLLRNFSLKNNSHSFRSQLINKAIRIIFISIVLLVLLIIWGVNQTDIAVFLGSTLTIVGVALFAQWSLLSNITSSILIFFNHSIKIGDSIAIMEAKEYEVKGLILDIGLIFLKIKTLDTQEEITIPNNVFIQKTIRKLKD